MPARPSYVPKHRSDIPAQSSRDRLRRTLSRSGAAAAATGLAVSSCLVLSAGSSGEQASAAPAVSPPLVPAPADPDAARAALTDRKAEFSRSVRRSPVDVTKARALSQKSGGQVTKVEDLTSGDPRTIARAMLAKYGFGQDQFSCLDSLYVSESGWKVHADNPSSSAYGIPQALPGEKMSSAAPTGRTTPPPRSSGGSATSRAATAPRATPGASSRGTAGTELSELESPPTD